MQTVTDFVSLGSKITAVTAAMKLKDAPWKKSYDKPRQHIKNQRHHFADIVKAMVFLAVIYKYESQTIKKAEGQRIEAFKLWCWRRLFRVPCTATRSSQS